MTEVPDYVIRPTVSTVHGNLAKQIPFSMPGQGAQDQLNRWRQNLAGKDALADGSIPVSGASLTGPARTNTVGIAPATSVALSTTNMLVSQNFSTPSTIVTYGNAAPRTVVSQGNSLPGAPVAQGAWSWDGTDGNITLGCARVDCNGSQQDLISSEIPVIAGEHIEVACQVKWQNIVYTGTNPISIGVEKYRKGNHQATSGVTYLDLGGVDVAWLASPAANGGWGTDGDLAGIYTVEPGIDQVRFRFRANTSITSGTVKWDEAIFLKLDLIDDAAVPGVGTTVDNIVHELYGTAGDSFTHNQAAVALANTSASLMALNARVSAMEAGTTTGAIAGDDFLWTGEITANVNWGGNYSLDVAYGTYSADGADAVWISGAAGYDTTQTGRFDWQGTDAVSDTDYQLVQLLLASAPVSVAGFTAYVDVLGRIASDWSSYVRARFGSDGTYVVDYYNGSSFVIMASGTCPVPGLGTLLSLYCGNKNTNTLRRFKLMMNNTIIADFDEVGIGSSLGAANRKWGWGGTAVGGFYYFLLLFLDFKQATPPKVNQWLAYDQ